MDDVGVLESHLTPARAEAEEVLITHLLEVAALDIEFAVEKHLAGAQLGVSVDVLRYDGLGLCLAVGDDEFDGVEDGAYARCRLFLVLAEGVLQQAQVNHSLHLGVAYLIDKLTDSIGCVSASAQTADGRHAGVVPAADKPFLHELEHLALRHHGVGDVQSVELVLVWAIVCIGKLVDEIVVERAVHDELQRADGVGYALKVVALSVCKVVHRIHIPFSSRAVVRMGGDDAVHDRVAEVHIGVRHINLRA